MASVLHTKIEYCKGIGPQKARILQQELQIHTYQDLLTYYPFRYENYSTLHRIKDLKKNMPSVQLQGTFFQIQTIETGKKRIIAHLKDQTGTLPCIWFQGLRWILAQIKTGHLYRVRGKLAFYQQTQYLIHPEIEIMTTTPKHPLIPIYHTTEALKKCFLPSKGIMKLIEHLLQKTQQAIPETLPDYLLQTYKLIGKKEALSNIHFPTHEQRLQQARYRLKFEELFYLQLQLLKLRQVEKQASKTFQDLHLVNRFYHEHLPFALTDAQKKVLKEIYKDIKSGKQMNRLLQGDVGSGKTIVAFISMLYTVGSKAQVALMAPTELLAEQHYHTLQPLASCLNLTVALLTGSTKQKEKKTILAQLQAGTLSILVGTHALVDNKVCFHELGMVVIDEQHRFGVMQKAELWKKNPKYPPHILVMTATPIPRTLAMTVYGDLDLSLLDEMPACRKPIQTFHCYEGQRLKVLGFIKQQVDLGRQAYLVYPLIEESAEMDYMNLIDGYANIQRAFPEVPLSIIHGQMLAADKTYEMQRFAKGETKIMVATTVIEVGIDVPNATVIVIESAERFGLSQLHQLRGRVGRGPEQSYCILMTDNPLSAKSKERIQTMVRTHTGFEIAEADLRLRGPGDLMGVQQSGSLHFKIADLSQDEKILQAARDAAKQVIQEDPTFTTRKNACIQEHYALLHQTVQLGRIA